MLSINSLLSPACVLIHPDAKDKASLIKMMIDSLEAAGKTNNSELLLKDVMAREELSPTGLNWECAVPHAHSSALEHTSIASALLDKGIDFNAQDGYPARLIFLIAGPKDQAGLHLKLLSRMARILNDREFRENLMNVSSEKDFIYQIKKRED